MQPHDTTNDSQKLCECGCGQPAPIAKTNIRRKGHVKGQPVRFIVGHHNKVRRTRPTEERFWEKVDRRGPDDCWLWQASISAYGYGQFHYKGICWTASRFAYFLTYGPIPDGMDVCHNCPSGDNPACCNPAHFFLGTQGDNARDMWTKGRASNPPLQDFKGEKSPRARFTNAEAEEFREQFASLDMSVIGFAHLHNVSNETMRRIIKRITYQDT